MARKNKSETEIDLDTIEANVFMMETMLDVIKRDAVEDAEDILENLTVDRRGLSKIQGFLEQIIKIAKRVISRIGKDELLDAETRRRILTKTLIYHDNAIKILSKVDGLEVVTGKRALKTLNSIMNDCQKLDETLKLSR